MIRIIPPKGMTWGDPSLYEEGFYGCCRKFIRDVYTLESRGNYSVKGVTSLHERLKLIEHIAEKLNDKYVEQFSQEIESAAKNPITAWLVSRGKYPIFPVHQERTKKLQKMVARVRQASGRIGLKYQTE